MRCVNHRRPFARHPATPPRLHPIPVGHEPLVTMSLSLFPRAVAPLRLAARSAAPSTGVLTRWAASTPAASAPAVPGATPTPAPAPAVVAESTAGAGYATTATSSARNSPVANLQGAQPIGNSEYVVRLGDPSGRDGSGRPWCAMRREETGSGVQRSSLVCWAGVCGSDTCSGVLFVP